MSNVVMTSDNNDYAMKLDNMVSKTISDWWNNLSKEDILEYLAHQPDVTADKLRDMLANEQCVLNVGVAFDVGNSNATVDFHTA